MRRLVLALVLLAAPAYAQAPFPGAVLVNGGWVPCTHPIAIAAGKGCVASTVAPTPAEGQCVTVSDATVCSREQCAGHIDLYTQGSLAAACAHYTAQFYTPPPAPVFRLGQKVRHAYGLRGVVIGITRTLAGVEVIVIEVTESSANVEAGDLIAQINGSGNPWRVE